jgi:glycosyltransferase involved in cell wall biosynthesis
MTFCIFSFNRGPFLENCLRSLRQFAPDFPVVVVDDGSTDPATREVLAALPPGVTLMEPKSRGPARLGGLYNNMQTALLEVADELLLFLQDDMQIVRPVGAAEVESITRFFQEFPRAAFLHPCFLKGTRRAKEQRRVAPGGVPGIYFRGPEESTRGSHWFQAVSIVHAPRLRAVEWKFAPTEAENAVQARQHFSRMGLMAFPFLHWLPDVPVWRGKKKSWCISLAERWAGMEPKVFAPLEGEKLDAFLARPVAVLPFAEDFLTCPGHHVKRPFQYSALHAYPALRGLQKIEGKVRRWFS